MATTTKTPFDLLREHITGTVEELAEAIHGECIHPETGRELDGATVLEHWHDTEYPQFDEEHLPETLELSRHQLANIITEAVAAQRALKKASARIHELESAASVVISREFSILQNMACERAVLDRLVQALAKQIGESVETVRRRAVYGSGQS